MSTTETPSRLPIGARVAGIFLVAAVEPRSYGEGKDCTVLTLSDPGGRIDSAPFWAGRQELVAGVKRGSVVEVAGEIQAYRGRRQLEVARIVPVPGIDPAALLPAIADPAAAWRHLDQWRAEIRGPRLAAVVSLFYDDPDFRRRYGRCPASPAGHHALIGGLLAHTCEVAAIGRAIALACGADTDLVLAGALLHDIGKLEAYRWDGAFETTEAGALLGHVALGLLMLSRGLAREPAACTDTEALLLLHLVGSHHGRLEYGAAAPPLTLEAEVLHYADDASARTASMAAALADADNFPSGGALSARGLWQLDKRRGYRGRSDWGR